jgi:hypothetical protein
LYRSETISISIACPFADVYDFLVEPLNLPTWTSMLGDTIRHVGGNDWILPDATPGPLTLRLTPRNPYGVIDYFVIREGMPPRQTAARVFPNGNGAELVYTAFQLAGVPDAMFASNVEWLRVDLMALKSLLESRKSAES